MTNPVVWFEVLGQHADKLRSFYGELLGWSFDTANPAAYGMVKAGRGGIPGGIGTARPGGRGWLTFYAQVPDLAAAVARAEALGSRVLIPITKLQDTTIAVVSDPEGNPLGLCTAA